MTSAHKTKIKSTDIRKQAEDILKGKTTDQKNLSSGDAQSFVHELQVHQIELEMQNEELQRAQIDLENTKDMFIDLYDFAPVGYFTFSREGLIKEVNLTGAKLLGNTRTKLINCGFGKYVVPSDFKLWNDHLHLSLLLKDGEKKNCELGLKCEDGAILFVRLDSVRMAKTDGTLQVRSAVSDITERKREHAKFKDTRIYLDTIIKSAYDSIFVVDEKGRFEFGNEAFFNMTGYPENEIMGQSFMKVIHPDYHNFIIKRWDEVQRGEGKPYEVDIVRKDRAVKSLDVSHKDMEIGGKRKYWVIAKDITERKRVEEALRESEAILFNAFNNSPLLMTISDFSTGKYLVVNDSFCRVSGFNRDEAIGKTSIELGWLDEEERKRMMHELQQNGKVTGLELNLHRKGGKTVICRYSGDVIQDAKGNKLFSTAEDITELKYLEELKQRSEENYRTLVENSPDYIMRYDRQHRHIFANSRTFGANNMTAEEFIGKTHRELGFDPNLCDRWDKAINNAFETGQPQLEVFEWEDTSGAKLSLEWRVYPEYAPDGSIETLLGISRDITQRKLAEEERIKLIEKEQEARAEAQAAKKLAHMKSMFIASTSHELRTPLNSIIGFTSLTIDGIFGELNPDQKKYLMLVYSSGKHLLSLVNDILDLSLIESGNIRVVVCEFNLRQIVDEAATTLKVMLNEKKLELKVDVSDIKMKSDRTRLLQCLINLISNAIKFTEKGSVEITAKVTDKNVEISVIDTGIGIKKDDIPKLFGPFVRLQTPLTLKTPGTGLGLYLIKIIAKDVLGGDVEVKSEFGMGSKFTLRIPVELEGKG